MSATAKLFMDGDGLFPHGLPDDPPLEPDPRKFFDIT